MSDEIRDQTGTRSTDGREEMNAFGDIADGDPRKEMGEDAPEGIARRMRDAEVVRSRDEFAGILERHRGSQRHRVKEKGSEKARKSETTPPFNETFPMNDSLIQGDGKETGSPAPFRESVARRVGLVIGPQFWDRAFPFSRRSRLLFWLLPQFGEDQRGALGNDLVVEVLEEAVAEQRPGPLVFLGKNGTLDILHLEVSHTDGRNGFHFPSDHIAVGNSDLDGLIFVGWFQSCRFREFVGEADNTRSRVEDEGLSNVTVQQDINHVDASLFSKLDLP